MCVCVCVGVCVESVTDTGLCRGVPPISGDFDMIKEGDRLLLGLSGGKDSMSLLHCLLDFQRRSRVKFQLGCVTVDPQSPGFQPGPLREYVARCVRSDSLLRKRVHALLSTPCARVQDVCEMSGKVWRCALSRWVCAVSRRARSRVRGVIAVCHGGGVCGEERVMHVRCSPPAALDGKCRPTPLTHPSGP